MIRITDMTLSCIEAFCPSARQLKDLYALLLSIGSDYIEMPAAVYDIIKPASADKILLRVSNPGQTADYPNLNRFICRKSGFVFSSVMTMEIQINDIKEINLLGQAEEPGPIRLVGLDDVLCHDFTSAFIKMQKRAKGHVEFCPENSYSCATAAAIEWIMSGGTDLAAAFGGIGGKAPLEEVLLALRVVKRHKPSASFAVLPQLAALMEEITGTRYSDRKAVIGRKIFDVESGIHIDGILKKPQMYEPFLPELVGGCRKLIVGKHSGRKSIGAKLQEMGYSAGDFDIAQILSDVRDESVIRESSLTDEEFYQIALYHRL
jgi:homocitrate synthase NifV